MNVIWPDQEESLTGAQCTLCDEELTPANFYETETGQWNCEVCLQTSLWLHYQYPGKIKKNSGLVKVLIIPLIYPGGKTQKGLHLQWELAESGYLAQ